MTIVAGGVIPGSTRGFYRTQDESIQAIQLLLTMVPTSMRRPATLRCRQHGRSVDYERDKNLYPANEGEVIVYGQTVLHGAGKQGWTEVARFLLQNGARQQVLMMAAELLRTPHGRYALTTTQHQNLFRYRAVPCRRNAPWWTAVRFPIRWM